MGYSAGAIGWYSDSIVGVQAEYSIGLDDVQCGSDQSWSSCTYETRHNCVHNEDVFLTCDIAGFPEIFELYNEDADDGTNQQGLLLFNGQTVCDDEFDLYSANAICRKMGFAAADEWTTDDDESYTNTGQFEIGVTNVNCSSNSWESCHYMSVHDCSNDENVELSCLISDQMFMLVDERGSRIDEEMQSSGQTGLLLFNGRTVCDDVFNDNSADAICREMGYSGAVSWRSESEDSDGLSFDIREQYEIGWTEFECETSFWDSCTYRKSTLDNCNHDEDVHLTCERTAPFTLVDEHGSLMDPSKEEMGLLLWNGETVCDDDVDETAAHAICKDMGYPGALSWTSFNKDSGFSPFDIRNEYSIGMDNVVCSSASWGSCDYITASHNCDHTDDVHLRCGTPEQLNTGFRLIDEDGNSVSEETITGLLLWNGRTVCDDGFDMNAALAICREMGYRSADSWTSPDENSDGLEFSYIRFDYFIGMNDVNCDSNTWDSCSHVQDGHEQCNHDEDVYLSCSQPGYDICTWDWNAYDETHCCDHPNYHYDSRCTSGAGRGQLISLVIIVATVAITVLFS